MASAGSSCVLLVLGIGTLAGRVGEGQERGRGSLLELAVGE